MNNLIILLSVITWVVVLQHVQVEGAGGAGGAGDNTRYYCCSCCGYDLYCNRNSKGGISVEKSEKKVEPFSLTEDEKTGNGRNHGHTCCSCCGYTTSCNRMGNIFSLSQ